MTVRGIMIMTMMMMMHTIFWDNNRLLMCVLVRVCVAQVAIAPYSMCILVMGML